MSSGADLATAMGGVPEWLIYLGGLVVTPLVGLLVLYLRRLLRLDPPPKAEESAPISPGVPQMPTSPTTTGPDPEIAIIASTMDRLWTQLESAKAEVIEANRAHREAMASAERRHREAMAAAEAQHSSAMASVAERLRDREETISQLRSTIDALTGRSRPS